jgi:hypothetical protein
MFATVKWPSLLWPGKQAFKIVLRMCHLVKRDLINYKFWIQEENKKIHMFDNFSGKTMEQRILDTNAEKQLS